MLSPKAILLTAGSAVTLSIAQASTFQNTLAWTRYLPSRAGYSAPDSLGNTCVVTQNDLNGGGYLFKMTKFDKSGNAVQSSPIFSSSAYEAYIAGIYFSPLKNGSQSVYVLISGVSFYGWNTVTAIKLDPQENLVYARQFGNYTNSNFLFMAGQVDSSDNLLLALRTNTPNSIGFELVNVEVDPSNNILQNFVYTDISPQEAIPSSGKWIVDGADMTKKNTTRVSIFDPYTGGETVRQFPPVDNGTNTYEYSSAEAADATGFSSLITVQEVNNTTHGIVQVAHFVKRYDLTGNLMWTSPSHPGYARAVQCVNGLTYVEGFDPTANSGFIECFSATGAALWNDPSPNIGNLVADSSGLFSFYTTSLLSSQFHMRKFDPTGAEVWTYTNAPPQDNYISQYESATSVNGVLYVTAQMGPSNIATAVVQRFVSGVTISALSAPATITAGTTGTLKVLLNGPAPAGGTALTLNTHSARLLFSNNSGTYATTVPAGSLHINLPVHALSNTPSTQVTVSGNQNGVIRQLSVAIKP